MAKVRITKELDSKNAQYFKLTKKRGKITAREAFEAMEESYYFGEYLIQFNVPEEAPMDLYEDGDEWRLYAVKELLEEEIYKAHQEGYEECKKDFKFEKTANSLLINQLETLLSLSYSSSCSSLYGSGSGCQAIISNTLS